MHKILALGFLFCFLCSSANGQILKYRATSFIFFSNGAWGEQKECDVLIVMDLNRKRITIYSDVIQKFDVVDLEDSYADSDGDTNWLINCVDQDGDLCTLVHCICESQNGLQQLSIKHRNTGWGYTMRLLD